MTAPVSNYEFGQHLANRGALLWMPKGYKRDGTLRGVVYVHGAGELAASPLNYSPGGKQAEATLLAAIASVYPVISFDAGVFGAGGVTDSNNWGNPNAQTEMGLAITRLKAAAGGGAKAGKVILVGLSMGHALSMTFAQANPGLVAAIVGVLPVNDLDDIRDNDRGGYRASISSAWGTGAWVSPGNPALPAGANPALPANQTNLLTIPQRLYSASDDAICTFASSLALVANLGAVCTNVNMGAGGHTDTSIGHVDVADALRFMANYA